MDGLAAELALVISMPMNQPARNPFQIYETPSIRPVRSVIPIQKPAISRHKPEKFGRFSALFTLLACLFTGFFLAGLTTHPDLLFRLSPSWILAPVTPPAPLASPSDLPLRYDYVSSAYGPRWGRLHQGIDLAAPTGTLIYAASGGKIIQSGWEAGYGRSVVIDHGNGLRTRYAHCSRLLVKKGQRVTKGTLIAKVGSSGHSTGPHLHFEVILKGMRRNPAWYYAFPARNMGNTVLVSAGKQVTRPASSFRLYKQNPGN